MKSSTKMSGAERRASIIRAVRRVFAEKGFHGTTTRALAEAAGVSEALLFRHFPDKKALYVAMLQSYGTERNSGDLVRLQALEPSTSTLVLLIELLVSRLETFKERVAENGEEAIQSRLVLRSLTEDGEFARLLFQERLSPWIEQVQRCIQAAVAAGDAIEGAVAAKLGSWFAHHLFSMLMIFSLSPQPVVDYGASREAVVEQAVRFVLRGIGLKEEVINNHFAAKHEARDARGNLPVAEAAAAGKTPGAPDPSA
jgi:AcrR family transcriptional regulator